MTAHRNYSGLDRPTSASYFMPKPPRTAGMRAKTDGKLVPMYRAGFLARLLGRV